MSVDLHDFIKHSYSFCALIHHTKYDRITTQYTKMIHQENKTLSTTFNFLLVYKIKCFSF